MLVLLKIKLSFRFVMTEFKEIRDAILQKCIMTQITSLSSINLTNLCYDEKRIHEFEREF